ncbi:MAG: ribosome assembly RNA-binding protein YhbY [Bilifractor sp.]
MTSKQRAFLKSLAMKTDAVIQIGRTGLTPEVTNSVDEALAARELVKINVQKNDPEDIRETAETLAGRTRSEVVQVIGRKIVLYRQGKDDKRKIF